MPELLCSFCGNKWNQGPLEFWVCPSCEMGAAREFVVASEPKEIEQLWSSWNGFSPGPLVARSFGGHVGMFAAQEKEELSLALDLLVLAFDVTILPYAWTDLDASDPMSARLRKYLDAGAIIPAFLETTQELRWARKEWPSDSFARYAMERGRFVSHGLDFNSSGAGNEHRLFWARENFSKVLSHQDFSSRSGGPRHLFSLLKERHSFDPTWFDLPYHMANRTNGILITASSMGVPLIAAGMIETVLRWKLGAEGKANPLGVLRKFASDMQISVPLNANKVLSLREDKAGIELRVALKRACHHAETSADAGLAFTDEYQQRLAALTDRAREVGDTSVAIMNGLFSTAGGLMGGTVGAVVGGIGGSAVSLGTKNLFEQAYKKHSKNWAYYFYELAQRKTSD